MALAFTCPEAYSPVGPLCPLGLQDSRDRWENELNVLRDLRRITEAASAEAPIETLFSRSKKKLHVNQKDYIVFGFSIIL